MSRFPQLADHLGHQLYGPCEDDGFILALLVPLRSRCSNPRFPILTTCLSHASAATRACLAAISEATSASVPGGPG